MKIYKLNLDVDNYQGCFINETNLTKRDFKEINRGRKLTFKEELNKLKNSGKSWS